VDGTIIDAVRLAVDLAEVLRHHRQVACRACDRICDEVRVGDAEPRFLQLAPASIECADRDRAEARRRGNRAALVHVASEHCRATLDQGCGCSRGSDWFRCGWPSGGVKNIRLEDPASTTGPGDRAEIHVQGTGRAPRHW
jgi:hypothetical protein